MYKSKEIIFDGSEDEEWILWYDKDNNYVVFYIVISDLNRKEDSYNNCFKFGGIIYDNPTKEGIVTSGNYNTYGISVKKERLSNISVDGFRQWLQSNLITVVYLSTNETFVPLSQSEKDALNALHTNYPTTVLSNGQGCEMNLIYKTRKNLAGGGNILDLTQTTLGNCVKLTENSIRSNIKEHYYCTIVFSYLNEMLDNQKGNELVFTCENNPEDRMISILIFGTLKMEKHTQR